jgi:hypothetical protein
LAIFASFAYAEEPNVTTPKSETVNPEQIDRDGKKICGWNLMSETERGGYRNMMHWTKSLDDRNSIRADHCARMQQRAKERGVKYEE